MSESIFTGAPLTAAEHERYLADQAESLMATMYRNQNQLEKFMINFVEAKFSRLSADQLMSLEMDAAWRDTAVDLFIDIPAGLTWPAAQAAADVIDEECI